MSEREYQEWLRQVEALKVEYDIDESGLLADRWSEAPFSRLPSWDAVTD